ncbi:MAG: CBS domain-containing protein [Anaerolineae bacterium]|nr:CBS domain-containing protein [Anaerolineae bacterium]
MSTLLVRDVMRIGVPNCRDDVSLSEAARLMAEGGLGFLVVLDEDSEVVGWLDEAMLARHFTKDYEKLTAGVVMNSDIPRVPPDIPAAAAVQIMLDQGLQQLFILHESPGPARAAAVFTLRNLVRVMAGLPREEGLGVGAPRRTAMDAFRDRYTKP